MTELQAHASPCDREHQQEIEALKARAERAEREAELWSGALDQLDCVLFWGRFEDLDYHDVVREIRKAYARTEALVESA